MNYKICLIEKHDYIIYYSDHARIQNIFTGGGAILIPYQYFIEMLSNNSKTTDPLKYIMLLDEYYTKTAI